MYTIAGFDVYASWVAVGVSAAAGITVINFFGAKPAAVFNTVLTIAIAGVGVALIAGATVSGDRETMKPLFDGSGNSAIKGIFSVAVMTPFMFVGFDVIPQAAEEIKVPLKKLGRIFMLSIVIAIVFYILVIIAVSRMLTKPELEASTLATADAMKKAFFNSDAAAKVLIIGGMAGILTSWNSFFVGGSRAIYAMAEANMIPRFLSKLHPKRKTPVAATILIGTLSCGAPFFGQRMMIWITDAGSFGIVFAYLLVAISFLILRKNEPDMVRPYKTRWGKFVGSIAVLMSTFMIILYIPTMPSGLVPEECGIVGFWAVLGVVFAIRAKAKYGKDFGEAEGLLHPISRRKKRY
ncbi:hypothetical protein AGMMS49940_24270 [Spirochaetia bacterium]|nr:hypothetical protein AGMMS49940_24270 [Spirochaetia bacterium]